MTGNWLKNSLRPHWPAVGLAVIFLFLATTYNSAMPILEGPDEMWHFAYVQHLAAGQGLPVYPEEIQNKLADLRSEFFQPPLYYLLGTVVTFWIDTSDFPSQPERNPYWGYQARAPGKDNKNLFVHTPEESFPYRGLALAVHLLRFISTLAGSFTVLATYMLSLSLFSQQKGLATIAAAFVAFNPQFLHISATANNDALTIALASWTAWFIMQAFTHPQPFPIGFGWGVTLGLALLSKDNAFLLIPVTVLALVFLALSGHPRADVLRQGAILLASMVALDGWWYLRNFFQYGSLFAIQRLFSLDTLPPLDAWAKNALLLEPSFWASFGLENIYADAWFYEGVKILDRLCALGLLVLTFRAVRTLPLQGFLLAFWILLLFSGALAISFFVSNPPIGRHLFPAISAIAVFLARGLDQWRISRPPFSLATVGVFFLFGVALIAPWLYIAPTYSPPPRFPPSSVVVPSIPTEVTFAEGIQLLGYDLPPGEIGPGGVVNLTLYWRPRATISKNYSVFVHLLDEQGRIVAQRDTYPGLGHYPTSLWVPGETIKDTYPVPIPASAAEGTLQIRVGLYFLPTMERLAVIHSTSPIEGNAVALGTLRVLTPP